MNRETAFVAAAAVVVAASLVAAAVVPGALADPTDDGPLRPGPVQVEEVPITPGDATGETATLVVEARLSHWGNPTENVTVLFRAADSESNLVETSRSVDVGTLTGDRETPVRANLTVAREGGYEIETVVYRDGERVDRASRRVSGLEALTPPYAESNVAFAESTGLQPVSVAVGSADGDRVSLDLSAALTNGGDEPTGDLEVTFVVRQAESNVVADRVTVPVGEIRAGRTSTADASVTVPDEYNYYVDAILWRDDVHVDSAQSVANLDPTERISPNVTEREVEFEVEDFESNDGNGGYDDGRGVERTTSTDTPGFGVVAGVVALLAATLLTRRRSA
ncbi:DUF7490 domain-containing protein [Haloprofundus salilacus]|uniref:DUF7490 domain-containing protein n=1 Tax=Haloprofundus salilacus TaxID=2876190 RepID=UPI001CCFC986|nr:PGF-CTERM sorting domain-containing protein [Haloprofundus salilacus]